MAIASTPAVAATAEVTEKKTRKPRDPNAVRKPRPAYLVAHVNEDGKIIVDEFSRDANKLIMKLMDIQKNQPNAQLLALTTD